ncbi:MAG: hypothetical protein JNL43_02560 [Flavobacteriales bacterium]|nr:hypothetical protein [Flavobacteriales bacterium]
MSTRPFKFLDSYTRDDASIFFGRDKEIEELHTKVFESRLLLVYGVSGSGKSSLVNCGLSSKFERTDWLPINVRRRSNITQDIIETATGYCTTPPTGKLSLRKVLRSVYLDQFMPVYLILDQLEELFIFGDKEEIDTFIDQLAKVLAADINAKVVLIIREEFLAQLTAFEDRIPELFENRARLEKMSWRNATQAIEGPCRSAGITVDPGFADRLLGNIAAGRKEVELTYLQVYLDRVYDLMNTSGESTFTNALLDKIGPVGDVLASFLNEQIANFPDPDLALTVFKSFVSNRGTKRLISTQEIKQFAEELGKPVSDVQLQDIILKAVNLRILKDQDDQGRYELRHDALAATIYAKISLYEKELIEIRQFIDQAYNSYLKRKALLSSEDIQYIAPYEDKLFLSKDQRAFVDLSRRMLTQRSRRRMAWGVGLGSSVIAVLSVLLVWALQQRSAALENEKEAQNQSRIAVDEKVKAVAAKDEADRQRLFADSVRRVVEQQSIDLQIAIERGDKERIRAIQNEQEATRQAIAKEEQRQRAEESLVQKEQALDKAEQANADKERVNRVNRASQIAQNSQSMDEAGIRGLMAMEAYRLMKENGGEPHAQEIVDALYRALYNLELKEPWKVGALSGEPRTMVTDGGSSKLLVMGNKGVLQSVDMKARTRSVARDLSTKVLAGDKAFLSPSRQLVLLSHIDGSFDAWSVATGQIVARGNRGAGAPEIGAFSAFGDEGPFITGDRKGKVVLWTLVNGALTEGSSFETGAAIKAFEEIPGSAELACISGSGVVTIVNAAGKDRKITLPRGTAVTRSASDGSGTLVLGTSDGSILLVDPKGTASKALSIGTGKACDVIAADRNGRWVADVNSAGQLSVHDRSGQLEPLRIRPADGVPLTMLFGGDEELYLGYGDGKIVRVLFTADAMGDRICQLVGTLGRRWTKDEWQRHISIGEVRNTCEGR